MKPAILVTTVALTLTISWAPAQEFPPVGALQGGPPRGMPMRQERRIVANFDKDGDKRLDTAERAAAREFLKQNPEPRRGGPPGGRRPGGFGPDGGEATPVVPGKTVTPADVKPSGSRDLYDPATLRTIFIQFENKDWEAEL